MKVKPKCQHRSCPPERCEKKTASLCILVTMMLALVVFPLTADASTSKPRLPSVSAKSMPTQTTKRQLIVDEFIRRLEAIDSAADPLANGYQYQTDIGKNDVVRHVTHSDQATLKAAEGKAILSVFDLVRTRAKEYPDESDVVATLPVQVRGFHFREGVTADELTKMLADVMQAVVTDPDTGQRDLQLGGVAVDVRPTEDGFIIPAETFEIDAFAVGFEVDHVIDTYGQ